MFGWLSSWLMYPTFPCGRCSAPESAYQVFVFEVPKGLFSSLVLTCTVYAVMDKLGRIISILNDLFFNCQKIKLDRNILSNNCESLFLLKSFIIINILWIQVLQSAFAARKTWNALVCKRRVLLFFSHLTDQAIKLPLKKNKVQLP